MQTATAPADKPEQLSGPRAEGSERSFVETQCHLVFSNNYDAINLLGIFAN